MATWASYSSPWKPSPSASDKSSNVDTSTEPDLAVSNSSNTLAAVFSTSDIDPSFDSFVSFVALISLDFKAWSLSSVFAVGVSEDSREL